MRNSTPLSLSNPPERVVVFVPGCGQSDGFCKWKTFQQTILAGIDSSYLQ
jgi:4-phytase/acid phosphatase